MTPSTLIDPSLESELKSPAPLETLFLELTEQPELAPKPAAILYKKFEEGTFQSSMLEFNRMKSGSKTCDFLIALAVNLTLLTAPLLAGLYFTDTLNLKQYESVLLVSPPPPPPPPPGAGAALKSPPNRRVFENANKLLAPTAIPKNVADIKEAPLLPDEDGAGGVPGGVPGGVAGGTIGGVLGGVIGGVNSMAPPPNSPKESKSKGPVRVGGRIRAPRIILHVNPSYPVLAIQTHTQGDVVLDAVLDESGSVVGIKVVSGPPLLIPPAIEAVRKWKYEPTYLNEEPVSVQMVITVTFQLSQ
jgi:protein TonB